MNEAQKKVVLTQWDKHQHMDNEIDFDVSGEKDILPKFLIQKGVWDPFKASGRYHARYLFYHTPLFQNKSVIEIGCGTGLMGVIMAKYGAKKVIMSDISPLAIANTKENVKRFVPNKKITIVQGDLFENVKEKADLITWMIPFFPGTTEKGDTISASMIMPPELLIRFLKESKKFLKKDGVVLIPSFSLGGPSLDPAKVGKRCGYKVDTTWTHTSINGIQQGLIYMHELRLI